MKQNGVRGRNRSILYAAFAAASMSAGLLGQAAFAYSEPPQAMPATATYRLQSLDKVDKIAMPPLDLAAVQLQDEADFRAGMAPRYAVPHPVNFTPENSGTWEWLDKETQVWRLQVHSPHVTSINLGFTRYVMPDGGRLFVYAPDMEELIRPFTAADNAPHGELWTPPINGETLMIEVTIPAAKRDQLELALGSINLGYRPFGPNPRKKDKGEDGGIASGSCNVDVLCSQGIGWEAEIAAVGAISTGGSRFCSGFLVNNTAQDRKPYFMTANHCGITSGNAASLVVFWNYQNSTCRTPGSAASGQNGNGPLNMFSTGSTWRASFSTSDFTLVELNQQPNAAWNLSWAGWDRSGANSPSGACIHHPNGQEKRITLYSTTTNNSSWPCTFPSGDNTHVRALWSVGVTEGGSSGSPLFDVNHRVIGQEHGGDSFCGATGNSLSDCYGRFSRSWTGNGTNSTRLSNWLDPLNTGATTIDTLPQVIPTPPNDLCANASAVGSGSTAFTTLNATTDGPNETAACNFGGFTQIDKDVWYKFIAPCTGNVTVSLCGSNFDAKLAVYGSACPSVAGQTLACNDDFCGTSPRVTFPVTANSIYRIRIGGKNNASGSGSMLIACVPSAPPCPADIVQNQTVDVNDLLAVISAWGPCSGSCPADISPTGGDGVVNVNDLLAVIGAWGPCPQ